MGTVKVYIPTALRQYADGHDVVELPAGRVEEVLQALVQRFGALRRHLYGEDGRLRNFVNVYVNDEDIRYLKKEETEVPAGASVSVVPSIAGGSFLQQQAARIAPPRRQAGDLPFTMEEIKRYSRHLILPEAGIEGQRKLKEASVLVVGTGGLGAPVSLYLAAAGVGRLGLVDFDVVEHSNLQRQVLFAESDVGRPKLQAAKERLEGVNPNVRVETHATRLTSENAMDVLRQYDVVIDGTDNFPTRYLVNDACVLLGKPNVYGSIFRWEGQASVFWAEKGPCYRCLYAEPPPPGLVPSCAEGGVFGVLPGIVGSIQATEAIKVILGKGEPLIGRLLLFDAMTMKFRELKLRKNPDCPACGTNPTVKELIDYDAFCGISPHDQEVGMEWSIAPEELKAKLDRGEPVVVIDVREPMEYQINRIPGARLIPLGQLPYKVNELSTADEIVLHCKSGPRSATALRFLRELGFQKLKNLDGGIDAWVERVDPSQPMY
ncbi:MAG: molybdopterin-synthase adenylyltransferase MoeB [Euryarchaeota archaeon]|nr:molybdopterin-synthase adenylyltransferase MoeB [Euryarchaeota archaeon]